MKRFVFLFSIILLFSTASIAQNEADIKFDKLVHDFGELIQDDNATYEFHFVNTGKSPLILSNVRSSCGCTVPTWSKEPIMPGESGAIKVKYDSRRIGAINKQITVESNAKAGIVYLKIKGNISKKPTEIMPFQNIDNNSAPIAQ